MSSTTLQESLSKRASLPEMEEISGSQRPLSPMRVLYFAPKECWPPNTGARLRNYYLARELAREARVTYLGFTEDGAQRSEETVMLSELQWEPSAFAPSVMPPLTGLAAPCERVITVPRERGYTFSKLARGAIGRAPLPVLNYTTSAMKQELARLLAEQDFDVVQIESIHLIAYLPIIRAARCRPLIICDWHNLESEIMQRYSRYAHSLTRRMYAGMTARRLARLERDALSLFDAHLVVSQRDCDRLLAIAPQARVFVIENGVDAAFYSDAAMERAYQAWRNPSSHQSSPPRRHRILFVGSMDYYANVDAVAHFARECWPAIYRQRPALTFTIVGRHPRPQVRALAQLPGIEVTGTVEDVRPYYCEALAEVVPLRVGGGSRLKILEAMAAGVPVISTRLGAEGLIVKDGETIALAETADDFCRALCHLIDREQAWQKQADAARAFARARYAWQAIGTALSEAHLKLRAT
jgi:glycosyltransferase involved in cell wall biosynthesis